MEISTRARMLLLLFFGWNSVYNDKRLSFNSVFCFCSFVFFAFECVHRLIQFSTSYFVNRSPFVSCLTTDSLYWFLFIYVLVRFLQSASFRFLFFFPSLFYVLNVVWFSEWNTFFVSFLVVVFVTSLLKYDNQYL